MKEIRITSARNAHGVKVKRCCASCGHKCIESDGTRVCALTMLMVQQKSKCKLWQMSEGMKKAGKGGGMVKRMEYLAWVQEIRGAENDDLQKGIITEQERKTVEEMRQMFAEKAGSIYVME